jgi:hypothetical protein
MQADLRAVKTSLDMRTKTLQESLADTRNDLQEELGLMFQDEARTTNSLRPPDASF